MKDWFTLDEIAACQSVSESRDALWARSNREGWRWGISRDGRCAYHITGLPKKIRAELEQKHK